LLRQLHPGNQDACPGIHCFRSSRTHQFTIRNAKVVPSGALVLVIDKSGSMEGEKMVMCRQAAAEAVRVLGANDHIGVVAFDGAAQTVVPIQQVQDRREGIGRRIGRLAAGGGTDMYPGMRQGFLQLQSVEAAVKHMILLTDGQTQAGDFENLTRALRRANVTVSAVAVGSDADRNLLSNIASQGGGKFYHVTSPRAIPRIFVKEAMRVSKPLVYEREEGFSPQMVFPHEILSGMEEPFPPITGFVLTDVKTSPLVEVALRSPLPAEEQSSTVLASWQYGLGRFVVLTTDAGSRWASSWTQWENYDALFTQIVRWSMRPSGHEDDYLIAASVEDGRIRVVVTALDQEREFVNFLDMASRVTTPDLQTVEMRIEQTAPGRYVGELAVDDPGSYFLAIDPGRGRGATRLGVSVPHAAEYKQREPNWLLLQSLASQTPVGGERGILLQGQQQSLVDHELLALDPFRSTLAAARNLRDAWPLLLLIAACVFFADVLVRRVAIDPAAMLALHRSWLRQRPRERPREQFIERLRSRKAEIQQQLAHHPHAARFEQPAVDAAVSPRDAIAEDLEPIGRPLPASAAVATQEAPASSYTSRLLQIKREVQGLHPAAERKVDEKKG
jgi:uncharacterized protein YegL